MGRVTNLTTPYPQIIRLARSGSLERAWALMEQHGLLDSGTDQRALTLQGRLVKDRAKLAEGAERARLFGESAALYAKAGALDNGSYPLINAASLSLLAGKAAQSEKRAREVLAALDANPDEAETPYWLGATRAEALLLLGQEHEARAALRAAIQKQPAAWEDHAATIGQFELLCGELGYDPAWLDQIRPPNALFFSGLIHIDDDAKTVRNEVEAWLERENIGFGYGALAAGADLWIAESLLARGAELHVVLPCDAARFREESVAAFGAYWLPIFDRLMAEATTVECLGNPNGPSAPAIMRGDAVAVGLAMQKSRELRSRICRLKIVGEGDPLVQDTGTEASIITAKRSKPSSGHSGTSSAISAALVSYAGRLEEFSTLEEALQKAKANSGPVAIDWLLMEEEQPSTAMQERLAAMAGCTGDGQIIATQEAAFGLLGKGADIRVGSAGDMRWAGGQMPLYLIS